MLSRERPRSLLNFSQWWENPVVLAIILCSNVINTFGQIVNSHFDSFHLYVAGCTRHSVPLPPGFSCDIL